MRTACCITKATNTHSEYVILIVFPLQQWLHERALTLRYTYVHCLSCFYQQTPQMQLLTCGGANKFFLLKSKWRVVLTLKSYRSPFQDDSLKTASEFWLRPETSTAELAWRLCTYWRHYGQQAKSTVSEVAWNALVATSAAAGCELPCGNCSLAPDPLRAGHHFHKPRGPAPWRSPVCFQNTLRHNVYTKYHYVESCWNLGMATQFRGLGSPLIIFKPIISISNLHSA
jgi:hypothetical protein